MTTSPRSSLNNGVQIPAIGLGVLDRETRDQTAGAVTAAIASGYRLIDTAASYLNERMVGEGIKRSGINRSELFVTTKLWMSEYGHDKALRAFDTSLRKLGLDYVDLYLLHWPMPSDFQATIASYKAAETLLSQGRARAIGVSNFGAAHLKALMEHAEVVPAVNQIELHPSFQQSALRKIHHEMGILTQAWSPIGGSIRRFADKSLGFDPLHHPGIVQLAAKHDKKPVHIVLRWDFQNGVSAIPKSFNAGRIKENIEIFISSCPTRTWRSSTLSTPASASARSGSRHDHDLPDQAGRLRSGMTFDFTDKVALVTGAAADIGLATAQAFAQAGAVVVLADIDEPGARHAAETLTAAGHRSVGVRCNVADEGDAAAVVAKAVSAFGRLDLAFSNAGVHLAIAETADVDAGDFDRVIAINLRGVFNCMKHELRHMRDRGSGAVVNCSSQSGFADVPVLGAYTASKARGHRPYQGSGPGICAQRYSHQRCLSGHDRDAAGHGTDRTRARPARWGETRFPDRSHRTAGENRSGGSVAVQRRSGLVGQTMMLDGGYCAR
jgi:diketogulonate reductase-like aldo/keto reductase